MWVVLGVGFSLPHICACRVQLVRHSYPLCQAEVARPDEVYPGWSSVWRGRRRLVDPRPAVRVPHLGATRELWIDYGG